MRFICSILQPFKYGFPLGLLFGVYLYVQIAFGLEEHTLFRWLISASSCVFFTIANLYLSARANNEIRIAWFIGFTQAIASSIVFGLIIVVLGDLIFTEELSVQQRLYIATMEFISIMTMTIIMQSVVIPIYIKLRNK